MSTRYQARASGALAAGLPVNDERTSLRDVTVLLLRTAAAAAASIEQFQALGAKVLVVPLTQTTELELPPTPTWPALKSFAWVVLSSVNGARSFAHALLSANSSPATLRARVACVGPATAAAWCARGGVATLTARTFSAEGLARELVPQLRATDRVLLAGAREPRDTLAGALLAAGIAHDSLALYATELLPAAGAALRAALCTHPADRLPLVVVFTASSSVRALVELLGAEAVPLLAATCLCAIGPTTAQELASAGVPATIIAAEAHMQGVVAAVRAWRAELPR